MHSTDTHELAEQFKDYLRGMRRARPAHLAELAAYDNWQQLAQREIERRAAHVLELLDDATLAAIASGGVRPATAIREVLDEHTG